MKILSTNRINIALNHEYFEPRKFTRYTEYDCAHLDCCRMVSLRAGESGIAALAVDATMLRYHIAIVSIKLGSSSFLYLHIRSGQKG